MELSHNDADNRRSQRSNLEIERCGVDVAEFRMPTSCSQASSFLMTVAEKQDEKMRVSLKNLRFPVRLELCDNGCLTDFHMLIFLFLEKSQKLVNFF